MSKFMEYVDRVPPLLVFLFAAIVAAGFYSAIQIDSVRNCLDRAAVMKSGASECKSSMWYRLL